MNLIIPMAGMGKRLRPHTLSTPKPLIPIAGKPIVQRLVEDIAAVMPEPIRHIGFVIGKFGAEVEKQLLAIAREVGAEGHIYYQEEALGTAHAVFCARELLKGKVTVAFADTLFRAGFKLNTQDDGIIWVQHVADPSAFGVVTLNNQGVITGFVEKPKAPVSDLAIIGIYYFKEGEKLHTEIKNLIDEKILVSGEYQLTTALENLKQKGTKFTASQVEEWLDCGNKAITVSSNSRYLGFLKKNQVAETAQIENSILIPPVFIGERTKIHNSVIGPGVSIGSDGQVTSSIIKNSLIQNSSTLTNVNLANSMIANFVKLSSAPKDMSLGDFSECDC